MVLLGVAHVVCLFSLLSRTSQADSQTLQLPCSEQLGADVPSNPTAPQRGNEPQICVSNATCCTRERENSLRARAVQETKSSLLAKYQSAQSSLSSLYGDLKGYFQRVIREGHRQSSLFLLKTQKNLTTVVISKFFKDLEDYMVDDKMELKVIVDSFFRDSFPMVLEYINPEGKKISSSYVQCLKNNMVEIQPFGRRPAELIDSSNNVFEPARILLRSLKFGIEIMTMAQNFNFTTGCENTLLRMRFCSLCEGISDLVKPCHNFCMDTVRNCLTSELQFQDEWEAFIDALSSLAETIGNSDLENFSYAIYKDLWNAAMYVLIEKANVMNKALFKCGTPTYTNASGAKKEQYVEFVPPNSLVDTRVFAKMELVKVQVNFLKTLYQDLPERLCDIDGLAAKKTDIERCWNMKVAKSYAELDMKLFSFQMTAEDAKHLGLLSAKVQKQRELMKQYTKGNNDEGSASASGSTGNEIYGSALCGWDDEDCGSSSGDVNKIKDRGFTGNGENQDGDIYFTGPSGSKDNTKDDIQGGGVQNPSPKPGKGTSGQTSSSTQGSFLLQLVVVTVFVLFSTK